ncbi:CU044_5270 family protein [Nonomuraea rhodomycinica]|uniref:CU044_5270 family protein n=1 Tax=Nonomuraea rhodomycinica TaxID=1712872 RepID=A0A7Y6IT19_9ACTN|nr:CU044_5270 family protein [Nonomuraea rhodomycinica]NUW43660.1 CU044_5270 family protein [Nonomuraea rhodomycinica]
MNEMSMLNRLRDEVPLETELRTEENRLLAEIRTGSSAPAPARARLSRPRPRWGMALAGALGMAVVAGVVTTAVTGPDRIAAGPSQRIQASSEQTRAQQPSAASVLENIALVAEKSTMREIRPDQWFYEKVSQPDTPGPTFEIWARMDGTQDALRENGGQIKMGHEKGPTYPLKTQRELDAFPDDPDALLKHLRGLERAPYSLSVCGNECPAGVRADAQAYGAIQWYLEYGPLVPPAKAAAMYRAMAKIPNVEIEENVVTPQGRKGIGVVLDLGEAGKNYTILDADGYDYLGAMTVTESRKSALWVLASGVVDKPGDVPSS